ncbi:GNAT family N-acetyltransferase [Saccharothrix sp. NPDC042600]|uniref:GNAT family N-acetyltransferase n=1 Tax=Saccharothrix TaxID=2071 RepID=UPI0033CD1522
MSGLTASPESAAITERLLDRLPAWFGIPEANAEYIAAAGRLPGFVAKSGVAAVGILLYHRHYTESAEVHLLAVDPEWHRRGVGGALVSATEEALRGDGCRLLQVKTLGAAHPDRGYADTRKFYRAAGFLPLEETRDLWPGTPCLIMVKALR